MHKQKNTTDEYKCRHSDAERRFTSTITTCELELALKEGFRVSYVFSAVHFEHWQKNIFTNYIKSFLKTKHEASGWPRENMTDEEKAEHILKVKEMDGIDLDPEKIKYNGGLRYLSKLCLNSLFGRFSLRCNLSTTKITRDPSVLYQILDDPTNEVSTVQIVDHEGLETIIITYKQVKGLTTAAGLWASACLGLAVGAGFYAGAKGAAIGFGFQAWVFTEAWPLNFGGKPYLSVPSFIPVTFELTVLFAAFALVFGFLISSKLGPGADNVIFDEEVTNDRFQILLEVTAGDSEQLQAALQSAGAKGVQHHDV